MLSTMLLDLTFGEVISSIPTDGGAIFAYVLIAVFIWFIWKGTRPGKPGQRPSDNEIPPTGETAVEHEQSAAPRSP